MSSSKTLEIAKTGINPRAEPGLIDPRLREQIGFAELQLSNDGALAEPLTRDLRGQLTARLAALEVGLARAGVDRTRTILYALEAMAARVEANSETALYSIERDIADLSDLPVWALEKACAAYRRGEIGDGLWRPTAGQIRVEATRRMQRYLDERQSINRIMTARITPPPVKPVSATKRKEIADKMRALAASLGGGA